MIDKITNKKSVVVPFKRAGFTKKGRNWYLDRKAALFAINFQQSDWDTIVEIGALIPFSPIGGQVDVKRLK